MLQRIAGVPLCGWAAGVFFFLENKENAMCVSSPAVRYVFPSAAILSHQGRKGKQVPLAAAPVFRYHHSEKPETDHRGKGSPMSRIFFFSGPCGCGKTSLADAWAKHLVRQEHKTVYVIHGDDFHSGFVEPEDKGDFFADGQPSDTWPSGRAWTW